MLKRSGKLGKGKGLKRGNAVLKRNTMKRKEKSPEQIALERQEQEKMWEFFLGIWEERKIGGRNYSEISGEYLGNECLTIFMHHIYEKSVYKDLKYVKDNIIMITWAEHQKCHQDMYFYEEVNRRRIKIFNNYLT